MVKKAKNPKYTLDELSKKYTEYGRYIRYMDLDKDEKKALIKARKK